MNIKQYGSGVFTVEDFLTPEECDSFIEQGEEQGFSVAPITTKDGPVEFRSIRNNGRVIFDDLRLSEKLYKRAKSFLPDERHEWDLCGLNERFRFYKYEPGQYFKLHKDGSFIRSETEESLLTLLIYLNEGCEGGETRFLWDKVIPKKGMALVFPHRLIHQGVEVRNGIKYVLRTDVMYRDPKANQS